MAAVVILAPSPTECEFVYKKNMELTADILQKMDKSQLLFYALSK